MVIFVYTYLYHSLPKRLKFLNEFELVLPICFHWTICGVFQAKDLPAMDLSGTSDPYVRVTLLPDKKHRLDTKVKRRTLNPRWNETLYFQGKYIRFNFHSYTIVLIVFYIFLWWKGEKKCYNLCPIKIGRTKRHFSHVFFFFYLT